MKRNSEARGHRLGAKASGILCRLGVCALLTAFVALLGGVGSSFAQETHGDPVQALRQALKTPTHDPGERDRGLRQSVQALHSLSDLRRALSLQEWRDLDPDERMAAIDRPHRAIVEQRFERAVRDAFQHGNDAGRQAVAEMLGAMGPTVRSSHGKSGLAHGFGPDLVNLMAQESPAVRMAAARALGRTNPDPAVAVPALSAVHEVEDVAQRRAAAEGLVHLMRVASYLLVQSRNLSGVEVTDREVVAVGKSVLPVAGRGLRDADPLVRGLSIEVIRTATRALNNLVGDPSQPAAGPEAVSYRLQVEEERAELMPLLLALRDQGPSLARALEDPDMDVRLLAGKALEELALSRQLLLRRTAGMASETGNSGPLVQSASYRTPKALPHDPLAEGLYPALPTLAAGLTGADVRVRRTAIEFLETLGSAAAPASGALVEALGDADSSVRWSAARTLGKIAPQAADNAVPALTRLLADGDLDLCLAAAHALGRYGPAAESALPALAQALRARDADLRLAALRALERVTPGTPTLSACLRLGLTDPDARMRRLAAEGLGRVGPGAVEAAAALRSLCADSNADVRKAASDALANVAQGRD